jgi:drug/metabolite transporter (DMT)-like permease
MPADKLKAFGFLGLAMATVGSIVPASKVIGAALPPFAAGAGRLAVAVTVLVPWALWRQRAAFTAGFDRHDSILLCIQAVAGTVGFTVLMILGTSRISAADASVVTGTLPAVAALIAVLLFGERPVGR